MGHPSSLGFLGTVGSLLYAYLTRRRCRRMVLCVAILGIVMVLLSAVAQPLWAYAIWLIAAAQVLVLGSKQDLNERVRFRGRISRVLLVLSSLGLFAAELPYHLTPQVCVPVGRTVYVVGDSLSAGIGQNEHCWPEVLSDLTGRAVVNLAVGGATAESAASQLPGVVQSGQTVIVEIGGNDLLSGNSAADFRRHLEALLSALHAQGHQVIMFELPLYPFRNAYGAVQRELAAHYGATLVPKRFLTNVIGMRDGTLDGLHFSQKGHDEMARAMAGIFIVASSHQPSAISQ